MGVTFGISQRKTDVCFANVWIFFSAIDLIQRSHFSRLLPQALKPEGNGIKFPIFLLPSRMPSLKLPILHESHLSSSLNRNNITCFAGCLSWLNEVAYVKMFTLDCQSNINCLSTLQNLLVYFLNKVFSWQNIPFFFCYVFLEFLLLRIWASWTDPWYFSPFPYLSLFFQALCSKRLLWFYFLFFLLWF